LISGLGTDVKSRPSPEADSTDPAGIEAETVVVVVCGLPLGVGTRITGASGLSGLGGAFSSRDAIGGVERRRESRFGSAEPRLGDGCSLDLE